VPDFFYAQAPSPEVLKTNREILTVQHEQEFGMLQDVLSGREHRAVYHFTVGHPFWKQKSWVLGSIQTNLHNYPSLTVRYDLYLDALLYLPDSLSVDFLAVNRDQVKSFDLEGVKFINLSLLLKQETMDAADMEPGYYEWVYAGNTQLFIKHWKDLKSKTGDTNAHSEFLKKRSVYIEVEGVFHRIKRKKDILAALSTHRSQIRTYLNKSRILIKKMNNFQYQDLLSYYDSL